MSHHGKLREDKRCENCGHFVEERFCPECGQENVETRQRFHYLFIHFLEDFVHYDGRFWKTIQYLLFRPAKLTREYLAGKRNRYVPPVSLYIFISFITFFIPAVLPERDAEGAGMVSVNPTETDKKNNDALVNINIGDDNKGDSIMPVKQKDKDLLFDFRGKKINIDKENLQERMKHDFPKAIFIYMPVFAFWLWLFHSRKKWLYFDHGIFTLHYFSFILLCSLLLFLFNWFLLNFHFETGFIKESVKFVIIGYLIYYFFHSHRLIYKERKAVSRLKCSLLFFINSVCISIFLISYIFIEVFISSPVFFKEIIHFIQMKWR